MGKLIVMEGLDASGKGTQSALLLQEMEKRGVPSMLIRLPNYEDDSSALVKMYLAGQFGDKPGDVNAYAASCFYAVDRYASFRKYWKAPYDAGTLLVADRYTTSNACHQMTKLARADWDAYLDWLFEFEYQKLEIPAPTAVIFLDMPVEVSQQLLKKRYQNNDAKKDVHERDVQYLYACRDAALYAAEKLGWHVISCAKDGAPRSVEEIHREIVAFVSEVLHD